jgi:ABC-2 type transport system permease protein
MNWSSQRINNLLSIVVGILLVWLVHQVAARYRFRLDMTEEKRYSIHPATKSSLRALKEPVFVEVYLEGVDLPPAFQRFNKSIRQILDEFSIYTDVQYRFVDPHQAVSNEARYQFFQSLTQKGIQPTNLTFTKDGNTTQKLIFPGAMVSVGTREVPVNLLANNKATTRDEAVNQSIEGLEFEFMSAIRQLTESRKRIGLVLGHGEPDSTQLAGFTGRVLEKFDLFKVRLPQRTEPLKGYDALVIAKPTKPFNEREKYLIDQYIMNGGSVVFFMDALRVSNLDSLDGEGTVALPYNTNLDDLLFKYGIRVNRNYILDLNCGTMPVVTGNIGDQPEIMQLPWPFFPVITRYSNHPSVKGLDASRLQFASTLDTVKAVGVQKTPLLSTSERTKVKSPPVRVAFNDLQGDLRPEYFQQGVFHVGYLLEGNFTSLYKNRMIPKGVRSEGFKPEGVPARIVVIGDGDLIKNDFDPGSGEPLDIGVDPWANVNYANGDLVMRLLDFLTDEDGLVMTRAKEIKIRPLDRARVKEEKTKWRVINMGAPLVLIVFMGLVKFYVRKRKYTDA